MEDFLDKLTGKQAQKVLWVLRLIEDLDPVPSQYFKKLVDTDDLWEVRVQFGGDTFRLLGFFSDPTTLVLTSGFAKKQQRTPPSEIALAQKRKAEFQARR